MFTNTKIALAAALMLGAASAALANEVETNPSTAQSEREWREFQGQKHMGNVGTSYGYFASPAQHEDDSGKRNRNR
jgi:hypothetical protein